MLAAHISDFKKAIDADFETNLVPKTRSTLANMLALDYETRLKDKIDFKPHLLKCIGKLHKLLGMHIITDDSFSVALTLFTKIIASEESEHKDNTAEKEQDLLIDTMIARHFSEFDAELQKHIKILIKDLLKNTLNQNEVINYIHSEPQIISKVVSDSFQLQPAPEQMLAYAKTQLTPVINKAVALQEKVSNFKQATSMVATACCILGVTAICAVSSAIALPLVTIPALILSNRIAPILGEAAGKAIINNNTGFQKSLQEVAKLKDSIIQQDITIAKQHGKGIDKNQQFENIDLKQFKDIKSHVTQEAPKRATSKTATVPDKSTIRGL